MSVTLGLSFPLSKALLIWYSKIVLIWGQFHFTCLVRVTRPIVAILQGIALV
jgi:hypothetical protein